MGTKARKIRAHKLVVKQASEDCVRLYKFWSVLETLGIIKSWEMVGIWYDPLYGATTKDMCELMERVHGLKQGEIW